MKLNEIYLAGGCFWGIEHLMKQLRGVVDTTVGYANGNTDAPTYEQVCTDRTGFAETVRVYYDAGRVGLDAILGRESFHGATHQAQSYEQHTESCQYSSGGLDLLFF